MAIHAWLSGRSHVAALALAFAAITSTSHRLCNVVAESNSRMNQTDISAKRSSAPSSISIAAYHRTVMCT